VSKRLVVVLVGVGVVLIAARAWASFPAGGSGSGAARAQTANAGNAPAASASGTSVTVSWSASTLSGGGAVDGYLVKRYDTSNALQTTGANCAGTVAALTCTENGVPGGTWQYSVTPVKANWHGAESLKTSVTVDTVPPAVTLTSPANGTFTNVNAPALSGAAGNAPGDSNTVTAKIYQGTGTGGSVLQTINVTRSGATWTTTAAALADGTYTAQATQTDTAGNTGTSSANTFTIDATPPTPTALTLANGSSGTVGKVDPKKDSVTVTFSEKLRVSSMCNTWSNDNSDQSLGGNGVVVVTITDSGSNDVLTVSTTTGCTLNLGSISLGGDYVTATSTFSGSGGNASAISWVASTRVLTISLGSQATGTLNNTAQSAGTPTYTPSTSITDTFGNAMAGTPFPAPSTSRF
jgi:Bacterial Ig-like domain